MGYLWCPGDHLRCPGDPLRGQGDPLRVLHCLLCLVSWSRLLSLSPSFPSQAVLNVLYQTLDIWRRKVCRKVMMSFSLTFTFASNLLLDSCPMVCQLSQHIQCRKVSQLRFGLETKSSLHFHKKIVKCLLRPAVKTCPTHSYPLLSMRAIPKRPNDTQRVFQKPKLKERFKVWIWSCSDLPSSLRAS